MAKQEASNYNTVLRVIANNLNTSVQNIDVTKSFDENGGNSTALLSVIKELNDLNKECDITLFEPPHSLQDLLNFIYGTRAKHINGNNIKVMRFADVENKDNLINMCCRSFTEKNDLCSSIGIRIEDMLPHIQELADEDTKHPLSLAVYDTCSMNYVGGAFLHNYAAENFTYTEKMHPIRNLFEYLETPHLIQAEKKDILHLAMCYAEPNVSSTRHLEVFQLLGTETCKIAKRHNFHAIASVAAHVVTQVCKKSFISFFTGFRQQIISIIIGIYYRVYRVSFLFIAKRHNELSIIPIYYKAKLTV